jgi:hypothetical protein
MFSAVLRASGPVFMFFLPELFLGATESVGSRFHVLRSRTHFRRYKGCRAPCFACPDSFLAVSRASGPVFIFCAPEIVFVVTECVESHFHVLRARTRFRRYRGRPILFSAVPRAPGHVFGVTEGRRVLFSCFACPNTFSAVQRASGPIFLIYAP